MGFSFGGRDPKARNLDLNLVPMIDLMSCMTAFLLVTAVWQDMGAVDARPKDKGPNGQIVGDEHDIYSVLVRTDRIFLADHRTGEVQSFDRMGGAGDWSDLRVALADLWARSPMPPDAEVEIAGQSVDGAPVVYQDLVDAMSVARATGLRRIDVVDPSSLSTPVL